MQQKLVIKCLTAVRVKWTIFFLSERNLNIRDSSPTATVFWWFKWPAIPRGSWYCGVVALSCFFFLFFFFWQLMFRVPFLLLFRWGSINSREKTRYKESFGYFFYLSTSKQRIFIRGRLEFKVKNHLEIFFRWNYLQFIWNIFALYLSHLRTQTWICFISLLPYKLFLENDKIGKSSWSL